MANTQGRRNKEFSCGTEKGDNFCHTANPQGGRDKKFSCGTGVVEEGVCVITEVSAGEPDPKQLVSSCGKGHDSCNLANSLSRRDKEISCGIVKGYDSCHLENPQRRRDKGVLLRDWDGA